VSGLFRLSVKCQLLQALHLFGGVVISHGLDVFISSFLYIGHFGSPHRAGENAGEGESVEGFEYYWP
jgi:hypothetical protein